MNLQMMREAQRQVAAEQKTQNRLIKEGDKVYQTDGVRVYESTVKNVVYETESIAFDKRAIGKSVFFSRAEAEQALKGAEIYKY